MVPFKPHSFRIFSESARQDANKVIEGFNPDLPGVWVKGCSQALSPSSSYDVFGRDVTDGFAFYVDISDTTLSALEVGGFIVWEGEIYTIETIQTNVQGILTDHTAIFGIKVRY